ncbi:MAG: alkaline phosphatase [Planctomycetia bacterium]|nr:alkaline phosphatase [Planctomycetia bacterium]
MGRADHDARSQAWARLLGLFVVAGIAGWITVDRGPRPRAIQVPAAANPVRDRVRDRVRELEREAERTGRAAWGHWGVRPDRYVEWSNHSNRLIPIYTFGLLLDGVAGPNSPYRDPVRIESLYGSLPDGTLNPQAEYCDQTDVHRLQLAAVAAGKRRVILVVFDGLDWTTTRTAAIAATGRVAYDSGRGTGFVFQDYSAAPTDFGFCVTSPANDGTSFDVDAQAVRNPGGKTGGGYDATLGGTTPWDTRIDLRYLTGRSRERPHAVTDSAASATALCSGRKTYNDAINVDPTGALLEPIAVTLQKRGWAVGAVSSVPVSHATPACAYANNVSRDDYQDIARDQLGLPSIAHRTEPLPGLDVLVGGGFGVDVRDDKGQGANFEPGNKYVAESSLRVIDAVGGGRYRLALRTPGRAGPEVLREAVRSCITDGKRLFGFFGAGEGQLPFATADGGYDPVVVEPEKRETLEGLKKKYSPPIRYTAADIRENPTLADMATAALDVLATRGDFWLMVEAGDVDWASHANNIDNCIGAVQSGDAALRAIFRWIEAHGGWADTAVIVTSDHGHLFVLTDPAAFATE